MLSSSPPLTPHQRANSTPRYSLETHHVLAAMQAHEVDRLVLVSSAEADLRWRFSPRVGLSHVIHPAMSVWRPPALVDLKRMEALVQGCDRLWTIVRGATLFDLDHRTRYTVAADGHPGWFTARSDLAAECVTQLQSTMNVHETITVTTGENATAVLRALYNASRARSARRATPTQRPRVDAPQRMAEEPNIKRSEPSTSAPLSTSSTRLRRSVPAASHLTFRGATSSNG